MTDNVVLSSKFEKRTAKIFKNFCDARGETVSTVLRRLVLKELADYSYLSDEEKKALGVKLSEGDSNGE
jgi:predicted transcriptional regulator